MSGEVALPEGDARSARFEASLAAEQRAEHDLMSSLVKSILVTLPITIAIFLLIAAVSISDKVEWYVWISLGVGLGVIGAVLLGSLAGATINAHKLDQVDRERVRALTRYGSERRPRIASLSGLPEPNHGTSASSQTSMRVGTLYPEICSRASVMTSSGSISQPCAATSTAVDLLAALGMRHTEHERVEHLVERSSRNSSTSRGATLAPCDFTISV